MDRAAQGTTDGVTPPLFIWGHPPSAPSEDSFPNGWVSGCGGHCNRQTSTAIGCPHWGLFFGFAPIAVFVVQWLCSLFRSLWIHPKSSPSTGPETWNSLLHIPDSSLWSYISGTTEPESQRWPSLQPPPLVSEEGCLRITTGSSLETSLVSHCPDQQMDCTSACRCHPSTLAAHHGLCFGFTPYWVGWYIRVGVSRGPRNCLMPLLRPCLRRWVQLTGTCGILKNNVCCKGSRKRTKPPS